MKHRLQYGLTWILVITGAAASCIAAKTPLQTYVAIFWLSNDQVDIEGNYFGLHVTCQGTAAAFLRENRHHSNRALLQALKDDHKFAAAHVLLSEINSPPFTLTSSQWDQMRIDLHPDGTVALHPEQIPQLLDLWNTRLGTSN